MTVLITYMLAQAIATAEIANNRVSSLIITDPGSGYNSDPEIVFTNDPGDSTGAGVAVQNCKI